MHADEVLVDDDLVRSLVDGQFPAWRDRPLARLPSTGTDNAIYRLGDDLSVRLPRIHWAVAQVAKEHEWLPRLAPHLPAAVPEPVAVGEPGPGYPYPWLVSRWVEGRDALAAPAADAVALAEEVAAFAVALRRAPTEGAPRPGRGRVGALAPRDVDTRLAIERLAAIDPDFDATRALEVWEAAVGAPAWAGPPVWAHGDLLPGNVLVGAGGRGLAGIIDWSAAAVGDPACDGMLAWALPPEAAAAYRAGFEADEATWARAAGWVVEQTVQFIPYYERTIPDGVAAARRRLATVLERTP